MKTLTTIALLLVLGGGDREQGLQLYREGRFAEAAAAFRAAIDKDGDSAELQWNLALASFAAGDLAGAETAAEKYAAMAADARADLHAGMLGAVRHEQARGLVNQALQPPGTPAPQPPAPQPSAPQPGQPAAAPAAPDPLPLLEQALQKAKDGLDHFVRGATANPTPELQRNTERALRLVAAIEQRIEELQQQREQKDENDKGDKNDEPKDKEKDTENKDPKDPKDDKGQQDKQEPQKSGEQKPGEPKPGEQKPEPNQSEQPAKEPAPEPGEPKPQPEPEPKPGQPEPQPDSPSDSKPQPTGEGKRSDAPGETPEGKELTPEQAQRLMELLQQLDQKQKSIRARAKTGRPPVERDW